MNSIHRALEVGLFATAVSLFVVGEQAVIGAPPRAAEQTRTVWDGVYTEEQAGRGGERFLVTCAGCHGSDLEGGNANALTAETFEEGYRETSVDYLFDYIQRNMPSGAPGTLSTGAYVDLTAFILSRNGFPSGDEELTTASMVGVRIVAEEGPGELPNSTLARVVGCLAPGEGFGSWTLNNATVPERIETAGVGENDATRDLGTRTFALMFVLTPLDAYVDQRVSVSGLLMGEGGADGINVAIVEPVAESCP